MGDPAANSQLTNREHATAASVSTSENVSWPPLYNDTWEARPYGSILTEMDIMYLVLLGIVMPVVSTVGVVTNLINTVVLSSVMRRNRVSLYHILLAMALADLLVTGVVLLYCARFYSREHPIATKKDIDGIDWPSYFFFHTWDTFANVCGMASNWCVVAVTTFRFVAVYCPLKAHIWCTRKRARIVILSIFAAAVVMNVPYALVVELDFEKSEFVLQADVHEAYKSTYYVVHLIVYHVIPWIACIALVTLLQLRLWSEQRIRRACSKQEKKRIAARKKLSMTFIGVALWFIVTTTPKVIYQFFVYAYDDTSEFAYRPWVQRFFAATQLALLLNYSANFFMYAVINRTYRNTLMSIVCCRKATTSVIHHMLWAIPASNNGSLPGRLDGASVIDRRRTLPTCTVVSRQ